MREIDVISKSTVGYAGRRAAAVPPSRPDKARAPYPDALHVEPRPRSPLLRPARRAHRLRRQRGRGRRPRGGGRERRGIRLPARRRRPPSRQLVAAVQVRRRRRLRLPDQPRRLRGAHRQPRRSPLDRRGRRLLRRRHQQLPLEPLLDLRPRHRTGVVPGGPLLRSSASPRWRSTSPCSRPSSEAPGWATFRPRRSPSRSRCRSTSSATSSGRSPEPRAEVGPRA